MSEVLQAHNRFVLPKFEGYEGYLDHQKNLTRLAFAEELVKRLTESGGIVGPIHEDWSQQEDFLFGQGYEYRHTVYANFTDLPEPELYRFMGGPADGQVMRTGGRQVWRVPVLRHVPMQSPWDVSDPPGVEYAEYELIGGDTRVYHFRRTAR